MKLDNVSITFSIKQFDNIAPADLIGRTISSVELDKPVVGFMLITLAPKSAEVAEG